MARDDIERARGLYEPIIGFSKVNANLEQVYEYQSEQIKLQTESLEYLTAKSRYPKRYASARRWP